MSAHRCGRNYSLNDDRQKKMITLRRQNILGGFMKRALWVIVLLTSLTVAGCGTGNIFHRTLKKAERGDASSQNSLGVMYCRGEGVPQDYTEAVKWFTKAAKQGHRPAQQALGLIRSKA